MLKLTHKRLLAMLAKVEGIWLAGMVYAILIVVGWGVMVRYTDIPGAPEMMAPVEELSRLILVWVVFLGASRIQREDSHYKMAILLNLLGRRARLSFLIIGNLAAIGFLLLVISQVPAVLENNANLVSLVMMWPENLWTYGYLVGISLMLIYMVRRVIRDSVEFVRACQQ